MGLPQFRRISAVGCVVGLALLVPVALNLDPQLSTGRAIAATASREQSIYGLAKHLNQTKAKMYGAFWCPYCQRQEKSFGGAFAKYITYIECDARGKNPKPAVCRAAGVRSFPTWEIKGRRHEGYLTLAELARLSGYRGPQNF
jgi:hypothetical protein